LDLFFAGLLPTVARDLSLAWDILSTLMPGSLVVPIMTEWLMFSNHSGVLRSAITCVLNEATTSTLDISRE